MTSKKIRKQFLDFFKDKDHRIVDSAPVVPFDDPTLLFTNAGMNQFKDIFLGAGTRDYKRAADTQKCIRVSGKHNDLEEVGYDTYHHTFFEMLGNWSFGDYYKEEAIVWAWELLTEVWKLPKERLWATVYRTDDEAFELWKSKTDINPDHILRFDEKDNFWEMGETGPCGPCSEIHINIGDDYDNPEWVNAGEPECIEIWNLVFIQYNKDEQGRLHELPAKHVDTGMGFERLCAIIQGKDSNYDTDVFSPLIEEITRMSDRPYEKEEDKIAMRVIADHVRTLTFAIADGAAPGNEGRGYVLRRILRRAARYGRKLDMHEPFLFKLVDVLVIIMGDIFPEISKNKKNIKKIIKAEEKSFNETLDRGIALFDSIAEEVESFDIDSIMNELKKFQDVVRSVEDIEIKRKVDNLIKKAKNNPDEKVIDEFHDIIKNSTGDERLRKLSDELEKIRKKSQKYITGEDIFKLYDTFGFPDDLVQVMAQEKGLKLDIDRFKQLMDEQKERARKSTRKKFAGAEIQINSLDGFEFSENKPTKFTGYDMFISDAYITGVKQENGIAMIILDESPFYVESGGQIDDIGALAVEDKTFEIFDLAKVDDRIIHFIKNDDGFEFKPGMDVLVNVNKSRRWDIMRNHSATHLLHAALREVLGEHVQQSGSYVGPDRLRFDFTHMSKLTNEEINKIEELVNSKIRMNLEMSQHRDTPFEKAKKMGALMFFGDKYGDKVNVVQFGDFSKEFCGGTHVKNSSEIGLFKIVSESSIASGVRRIEAVTGYGAEKYVKQEEENLAEAHEKIEQLSDHIRKLEKEIAGLQLKNKLGGIDSIANSPGEAAGIMVYKGRVEANNMDELKSMADELRGKIKSGVGVLISSFGEKVGIVAIVSDDLLKDKIIAAGKVVGEVAAIVGGKGGGRPHMATAGGKDVNKIDAALDEVEKIVEKAAQK
jgi:alanyl-tRNA synthetase